MQEEPAQFGVTLLAPAPSWSGQDQAEQLWLLPGMDKPRLSRAGGFSAPSQLPTHGFGAFAKDALECAGRGEGSPGKGFAERTRTAEGSGMQQDAGGVTGTEEELAPELRVGRTPPGTEQWL